MCMLLYIFTPVRIKFLEVLGVWNYSRIIYEVGKHISWGKKRFIATRFHALMT